MFIGSKWGVEVSLADPYYKKWGQLKLYRKVSQKSKTRDFWKFSQNLTYFSSFGFWSNLGKLGLGLLIYNFSAEYMSSGSCNIHAACKYCKKIK